MTLLNFNHKTRNIDRTEQEHKLNQRLRKQEDLLLHFSNSIYFQNLETIPVHCAESWRFIILEAYKDIDPISTINNKNTLAQL